MNIPEALAPSYDAMTLGLRALLFDAARHEGFDEASATMMARSGFVDIDGVVVAAAALRRRPDYVDNDVVIVCPLEGIRSMTLEQASLVLHINLALSATLGPAFAVDDEGELQLVHGMRIDSLDASTFAHRLTRLARLARSVRDDLQALAERDADDASCTGGAA